MTIPVCQICSRKLLDRYFDKCMYCGHPIPEDQRLSEAKKEEIASKRTQFAQEEQKRREEERARELDWSRSGIGDPGSGFPDIGGFGDGGGDGGL